MLRPQRTATHQILVIRMDRNVEKIRHRIIIPIGLILLALLSIVLSGFYTHLAVDLDESRDYHVSQVKDLFDSEIAKESNLLQGMTEMLIEVESVQDEWQLKSRDGLYELVKPIFERNKANYDITHTYFIDVDRVNFLRAHHPNRYGDVNNRYVVKRASETLKPCSGIELGKYGTFTLRYTHPWFIDDEHVGFITLGKEIENITKEINELLGQDLLLLIEKENFNREKWEERLQINNQIGDWDFLKDYVVIDSAMADIPNELCDRINSGNITSESEFKINSKSRKFIGGSYPLIDASGKAVGFLVAMEDITKEYASARNLIALLLLFGLVLSGGILFLFNSFVHKIEKQLVESRDELDDEIAERKSAEDALLLSNEEIVKSEMLFRTVISACQDGMIAINESGNVTIFNPSAERMFLFTKEEMIGNPLNLIIPDENLNKHSNGVMNYFKSGASSGLIGNTIEIKAKRKDGTIFPAELTLSIGKTKDHRFVFGVIRDITKRKAVAAELVQGQKLQSIGQLASGIAHEINTPTQFVGDNTRFLKDSFGEMNQLMEKYQKLLSEIKEKDPENPLIAEIEEVIEEIDLEFLRENIPDAINQSLDGLSRVTKIVNAMKDFAHPEIVDKLPTDINRIIESTVTVARNEWKYVADMELELMDGLPNVNCIPGEIAQVILNMIVNAAHAIEDVVGDGSSKKGRINISTRIVGENVEIRLSDTGTGIPDAVKERIFEPFFTTKDVGKGTGQGLAICRSVITEKHGGKITIETESGKGTSFIVTLPINDEIETETIEKTMAVH